MTRFAYCIAAAGAAAAFVLPAAAQTAQTAPEGNWTGIYVGGRLGLTEGRGSENETIRFDTNLDGAFGDTVRTGAGADAFGPGFCRGRAAGVAAATGCRRDPRGTDWAAHAGFDADLGGFVVGVVADYGRSTARDSITAFSTTPANYTMTRRLRDNASLRARAGVDLGNTLVYGTGGLAWGRIDNSFATSNTANSFAGREDRTSAWGWRAGGGVEQRVARNFSIGVQYLYTDLRDRSDYRVRAGGPAPAGNPFLAANAQGTDFARSSERFRSHGAHVTTSFRF
jgi:outer membrane immunogenic protein